MRCARMGKSKPFIDKSKPATVYRLVHPDEHRDGDTSGQNVGKLTKVCGPGEFYSDEEEEYPYREDSGSECEGDEEDNEAAVGECAEDEGEDEFADDGAPGFRPGIWLRTDDDAKSEYTSWSKRTASSYLPPERRMQLWRDIDDFGLPDDGYDYTLHLRNPGAGVRLDACYSHDTIKFLEKKQQLETAQADKPTREVLNTLEGDSDDEQAPALEEDEESTLSAWIEAGKQKVASAEVVEEGDMDDSFVKMMNDSGDEEEEEDALLAQPRDLRLLDEQFNAFLSAYDDDKIGGLSDDVRPARPMGAPQQDEAYYRDLLQSYINGTATMPGVEMAQAGVGRGCADGDEALPDDVLPASVLSEKYGYRPQGFMPIDDGFDVEDLADITAKTRALGLAAGCAVASDDDDQTDDSLDEVELQGKVQWDCESIVSTYSNIYNHPKEIADSRKGVKILINKATGLPHLAGVHSQAPSHVPPETDKRAGLPARLTSHDEEQEGPEAGGDDDQDQGASVCPSQKLFELGARQKHVKESADEKKARKEAAKELKELAREKKSVKKMLYKAGARGVKDSGADPRTKQGLSIQRYA